MGLTGKKKKKSRYEQNYNPSQGSRGRICFLAFQKLLEALAFLELWSLPPSNFIIPTSHSIVMFFIVFLLFFFFFNFDIPSYKDPCDYIWAYWDNSGQSSHFRILSLITLTMILSTCDITYSQILVIKMWITLESYQSAYHKGNNSITSQAHYKDKIIHTQKTVTQ